MALHERELQKRGKNFFSSPFGNFLARLIRAAAACVYTARVSLSDDCDSIIRSSRR